MALDVVLERRLPPVLPVGRTSGVFLVGTCFHRHRRVVDVAIAVDGARHRPTTQGMPRAGLFRHLHPTLGAAGQGDPASDRDPEVRCYRSGFWATVPVGPRWEPGEVTLGVEARLDDGTRESAPLGTIPVGQADPSPRYGRAPHPGRPPLIAICMATYNSDPRLFRTQIASIRAQTDRDWICVISDDCSEADRYDGIAEVVGDDERFVLSRSDERLGFYRNFERALRMTPVDAEFVALSDHDDRWYPDKLATLRAAIGSARLAYSDLRRVDTEGTVRAETLWRRRRNNHTNLASLLISNTVVGASTLFRREVIEHALPFPDGPGWDFHDHWLALVALALGDVAYVDRPLYDYVQHPEAILGQAASTPPGRRATSPLDRWRSAYFWSYLQRAFLARVLLARCREHLTPRKRRALRLMLAAERSPLACTWLAARSARVLLGLNETLLVEPILVRGILWRHLVALRAGGQERPKGQGDESEFPDFAPENLGRRERRWLASMS